QGQGGRRAPLGAVYPRHVVARLGEVHLMLGVGGVEAGDQAVDPQRLVVGGARQRQRTALLVHAADAVVAAGEAALPGGVGRLARREAAVDGERLLVGRHRLAEGGALLVEAAEVVPGVR